MKAIFTILIFLDTSGSNVAPISLKNCFYKLLWICCRKGDPFQGPKLGCCLTLRKELSEETRADTARYFIGKGTRVESSRVREPRRTALPRGSQSRVLWRRHRSAKMDASERDSGKWTGHAVSPFDLSLTLPVGGGLLVPYSLSGSPVIKQLMRMVTKGQGGRFQSVCFP